MRISQKILLYLASLTRKFHPRGTERLVRLICDPDKAEKFETTILYDKNLKLQVNTTSFIEWRMLFWGMYEPEVVALIKENLPKNGVACDIGANIGVHTLVMSKCVGSGGRVMAFEPYKSVADRLLFNLALNQIKNVDYIPLGISDSIGFADLYLPKSTNYGIASLYEDSGKFSEKIKIEITTLDKFLEDKNLNRLDLIKIDIEGNEMKALYGAQKTLNRFRSKVIFEYFQEAWDKSGSTLKEAENFLEKLGYVLKKMGGHETYFNAIALPKND